MQKRSSFAKGLTAGVAVGAAAIAVGSVMMRGTKPVKKTKRKMSGILDTMSNVCSDLSCMMK